MDQFELEGRALDCFMLALSLIDATLHGNTIGLVREEDGLMHVLPVPGVDPEELMEQLGKADWPSVLRLVKLERARKSR